MTAGTDPRIAIKRLLKEGGPEADVLMSFMEIQLAHHGTAFLRGLKIPLANLPEEHALSEFVSSLETWTLDAQANRFADDHGVLMSASPAMPTLPPMPFPYEPSFEIYSARPDYGKTSDGQYMRLDRIEALIREPEGGGVAYYAGVEVSLQALDYESLCLFLDERCLPLGPIEAAPVDGGGGL